MKRPGLDQGIERLEGLPSDFRTAGTSGLTDLYAREWLASAVDTANGPVGLAARRAHAAGPTGVPSRPWSALPKSANSAKSAKSAKSAAAADGGRPAGKPKSAKSRPRDLTTYGVKPRPSDAIAVSSSARAAGRSPSASRRPKSALGTAGSVPGTPYVPMSPRRMDRPRTAVPAVATLLRASSTAAAVSAAQVYEGDLGDALMATRDDVLALMKKAERTGGMQSMDLRRRLQRARRALLDTEDVLRTYAQYMALPRSFKAARKSLYEFIRKLVHGKQDDVALQNAWTLQVEHLHAIFLPDLDAFRAVPQVAAYMRHFNVTDLFMKTPLGRDAGTLVKMLRLGDDEAALPAAQRTTYQPTAATAAAVSGKAAAPAARPATTKPVSTYYPKIDPSEASDIAFGGPVPGATRPTSAHPSTTVARKNEQDGARPGGRSRPTSAHPSRGTRDKSPVIRRAEPSPDHPWGSAPSPPSKPRLEMPKLSLAKLPEEQRHGDVRPPVSFAATEYGYLSSSSDDEDVFLDDEFNSAVVDGVPVGVPSPKVASRKAAPPSQVARVNKMTGGAAAPPAEKGVVRATVMHQTTVSFAKNVVDDANTPMTRDEVLDMESIDDVKIPAPRGRETTIRTPSHPMKPLVEVPAPRGRSAGRARSVAPAARTAAADVRRAAASQGPPATRQRAAADVVAALPPRPAFSSSDNEEMALAKAREADDDDLAGEDIAVDHFDRRAPHAATAQYAPKRAPPAPRGTAFSTRPMGAAAAAVAAPRAPQAPVGVPLVAHGASSDDGGFGEDLDDEVFQFA